jgi:hypothetical protein
MIVQYDLVMYQQHVELLQLLYDLYAKGKFIMNQKCYLFCLFEYELPN